MALWGVRDPGNVGTVLRCALAFGAASSRSGPARADPYGPKAVRASMGAIFAVPVARVASVARAARRRASRWSRRRGRAAARARSARARCVVGAERAGLPDEVVAGLRPRRAHPDRSESLNAAMAATVALYESTRVTRRA